MAAASPMNWHQMPAVEVARVLGVELPSGLSAVEVQLRHEQYGPNRLTPRRRRSEFLRFILQFHQPLIYLLLAASVITGALGEWVDASVIFGVVLVNAIVGYLQEAKAEKAIEALAQMVITEASVRRGGVKERVASEDLVPGDVVLLQSGDKVPADLRLFHVRNLQVDESALKQADIGVAMGIAGTDVAKGAADMLLTDDNFATIEAAVEEGRNVFDNLTKFIIWTLPANFGQGLIILAAVVAGVALPILPVQLLWVNMTTVLLLGLMLVFEPREFDLMQRPPRGPKTSIMTFPMILRIGLVSAMMLAGAFGLFVWEQAAHNASVAEARTIAVNVVVMVLVFYLLNCRSLTRSMFSVGVRSNPWILVGIAAMIAAQLLFTYAPIMNRLFYTAPISSQAWLHILAVAAAAYAVVGVEKWVRCRWARVCEENQGGGVWNAHYCSFCRFCDAQPRRSRGFGWWRQRRREARRELRERRRGG